MTRYDDFDPTSLLDDGPAQPVRSRSPRTSETRRKATSAYEKASNPPPDRGIYDDLATAFRAGADVYIPQGQPLVARLLQQRITSDDRLMLTTVKKVPRDEALIKEMVEYMIKWFWRRVANDQRTNALNTFLSTDWWDALVEETIDHQGTIRIPKEAFRPGGVNAMDGNPMYDAWPVKERKTYPHLTGSLSERLATAIARKAEESN